MFQKLVKMRYLKFVEVQQRHSPAAHFPAEVPRFGSDSLPHIHHHRSHGRRLQLLVRQMGGLMINRVISSKLSSF